MKEMNDIYTRTPVNGTAATVVKETLPRLQWNRIVEEAVKRAENDRDE